MPALTLSSLLLLAFLFAIAVWRHRQHASSALITLVAATLPLGGSAQAAGEQLVEVLLSTDPGAPSPQDVMGYFFLSPPPGGPPPLQAFSTAMPDSVTYLLPRRASGDFLAWLDANPDSVRAKLERYLLIRYSASADIQTALASLRSDTYVVAAYLPHPAEFATGPAGGLGARLPAVAAPGATDTYTQYGWDALNIAAAWQLAGGYALIGDADSGLAVDHPALRQFSDTGQYLGGNFIPASSFDIGNWPDDYDANVDEAEPVPLPYGSPCNPGDLLPGVAPTYAGHGTHIAGLIAANSASGLGLKGICKNCGIAMWKTTYGLCAPTSGLVFPQMNASAFAAAVTLMADSGVQVVNMSLGVQTTANYCASNPHDSWCLAIAHANHRDAVEVASSGNARTSLDFPASDTRVVAAGGFDSTITLWDESPGSTANCP